MVDTQHFCLRWNNYQSSITSAFENLRDDEDFVDVTLACDGKSLKAHRVVLSACSPYFRELLKVRARFLLSLLYFAFSSALLPRRFISASLLPSSRLVPSRPLCSRTPSEFDSTIVERAASTFELIRERVSSVPPLLPPRFRRARRVNTR